jgi:DNA topoisomerase-1
VSQIERKERSRRPAPPFITSRLQQEAARKLGFSAKKTMMLAQKLYEGVDLGDLGTTGLITYMRTDSVRIEPGALGSLREYIEKKYGKPYLPEQANVYKTKKGAQDAHEAIRPTSLEFEPARVSGFLDKDELRLYQLIWDRTVASQMTPAVMDQTAVDISAKSSKSADVTFRITGSVVKFPGFTAVYTEGADEHARGKKKAEDEEDSSETPVVKLPDLKEGDAVSARHFDPSQHFTQPPPRYTDASLIRDLEEKGIGRPSTYASILSNITDREYVEKRCFEKYGVKFSAINTVQADGIITSLEKKISEGANV